MPNHNRVNREPSDIVRNNDPSSIENILTFEIEDRFHVDSPDMEPLDVRSRIIPLLIHLLELLDKEKAKATFFVLGWVARRFPDVVALIASRGNEVASHGFTHGDVRKMPMDKFAGELQRSKALLEDIIQGPVLGYKAASSCLDREYLAHYRAIVQAGYRYDCSLSGGGPRMTTDLPFSIAVEDEKAVIAIPQSTMRKWGVSVRFGERLRVLPSWFTMNCLRSLNTRGCPAMINMRLWEIDVYHPRLAGSDFLQYSRYGNLSLAEEKLRRLLGSFRFTSCAEALKLAGPDFAKDTAL